MKFVLLVEGDTEFKVLPGFLKRWLDTKISTSIKFHPVNLKGCGNFKREAAKRAKKHLEGLDRGEIIAVIGLLDLYGFKYPNDKLTVTERHNWLTKLFEEQVNHKNFRMYCAVHELEAWIFSDPEILPISAKNALPGSTRNPEEINFDEPPAKLLSNLYLRKVRKGYKKTVDGPTLFKKLDPEIAYQKCPYLRKMLDEMLKLARGAGL